MHESRWSGPKLYRYIDMYAQYYKFGLKCGMNVLKGPIIIIIIVVKRKMMPWKNNRKEQREKEENNKNKNNFLFNYGMTFYMQISIMQMNSVVLKGIFIFS